MSRVKTKQGSARSKTILENLIEKRGGAYKTSGFDSVFFHVYTNVRFSPMKAERRGLTVGLSLDAPKAARNEDHKKRFGYWQHSKRLQSGGLVVLLMITGSAARIYLGVVQSSSEDIAESSKASEDTIQIQVSFFDSEVEWKALRNENMSSTPTSHALLLDNSVMYEASRPFLERLQSIEPTQLPFARYIARHDSIKDVQVLPPKYATAPGFKFKLQCLASKRSRHVINDLDISQPMAVENARRQLQHGSTLDPSQLDAVINSLVREVSLIQGYVKFAILPASSLLNVSYFSPPGTGKVCLVVFVTVEYQRVNLAMFSHTQVAKFSRFSLRAK